MKIAVVVLFVYAVLITLAYFRKTWLVSPAVCQDLSEARARIANMQKAIASSDNEISSLQEELRLEKLRHKAELETIGKIKQAVEPAAFAPSTEETVRSFE